MQKPILIISGFDSSRGAGHLVDVAVAEALDVQAFGIVSSMTQQSHDQLISTKSLPEEDFAEQLTALAQNDFDYVKIGMLPEIYQAELILQHLAGRKIIYDPVMYSSSGGELLHPLTQNYIKESFVDKCYLVTPNLLEAQFLFGEAKQYRTNTLIKGGHARSNEAVDVLYNSAGEVRQFSSERINSGRINKDMRGTGCILSTAICCYLAKGQSLKLAIENAKAFVTQEIKTGKPVNGKLVSRFSL